MNHVDRRQVPACAARGIQAAPPWRRLLGCVVAALLVTSGLFVLPFAHGPALAAETPEVQILEQTSASGFVHPGVGLTATDLRTAREMVNAGTEPWASYYRTMTKSRYASPTWVPSNMGSAVDEPSQQYNVQFMRDRAYQDSLGAMAQAIRYVITGEDVYRANALHAIRTWSNLDPNQYQYFADAHIHTGQPLYQLMVAAEIIKYTAPVNDNYQNYSLAWTAEDTAKLKTNLVDPHVATFFYTPNRYLNQHNYGVVGAVAGAIATDNADLYSQRVEWFTVNAGFNDVGDWNGSVQGLFREISADDPNNPTDQAYIQHQEAGRDAAHAWGDIINFTQLARMTSKQGTRLDPVKGTVSTASNAVDAYHFLNNRILAGAEYYMRSDSGYTVPWTDQGNNGNFDAVSQDYRGRLLDPMNELYYQYKYVAGVDVEAAAPMVADVYQQRPGPDYWYSGGGAWEQWNYWDSKLWQGAEYWVAFPRQLADQNITVPVLPDSTDVIVSKLAVPLNAGAAITEPSTWQGEDGYATLHAASEGAIGIRNMFWTGRADHNIVGVRVKSSGGATLGAYRTLDRDPYAQITVPDTGGQWRWITWDAGTAAIPASSVGDNILFLKASGDGGDIQVDRVKPLDYNGMSGRLTPPKFAETRVTTAAVANEEFSATFTATDPAASDSVSYSLFGAPAGMSIDPNSGLLRWTTGATGTTSFIIVASDGTSLATLPVTISTVQDRAAAIAAVLAARNERPYISKDEAAISKLTDDVESLPGTAPAADFTTALDQLRAAIASATLINPQLSDGSVAFPSLVTSPDISQTAVGSLADGDNQTYWGNLTLKNVTIDFGVGYRVRADAFGFMARATFDNRAQGTNVYGSQNGTSWTLLTEHSTTGDDGAIERVDVKTEQRDKSYRFLRFQVDEPGRDTDPAYPGVWTLADFRIYGERSEVPNALETVKLTSTSAGILKNRVVPGNAVNLTFTTKENIADVSVSIGGAPVVTSPTQAGDLWTWQANSSIAVDAPMGGTLPISINYRLPNGTQAPTVEATTDAGSLWVSTNEGLIDSTLKNSSLLGVDMQPSDVVTEGRAVLFDNVIGGNNKTRVAPSHGEAAIVWDLGDGNSFKFAGTDVLLQQDAYGTSVIGALRFEGSNDGQNWTQLTDTFQRTLAWQRFGSKSPDTSFRYLRIYNTFQIAMTELRVFGTVSIANPTLPDGSIDYRTMATSRELTQPNIAALADQSASTYWGDIPNDQVVLDLGLGQQVRLTELGFQARTGYASRIKGTNVYGSNDGATWDLLTRQPVSGTETSVERIAVPENRQGAGYRFLALRADDRSVNQGGSSPGIRNLAEFRLWGQRLPQVNALESVSILSPNGQVRGRVVPGNTATLTFTSKEELTDVSVTVAGQPVTPSASLTNGVRTWTANGTVGTGLDAGSTVPFTVDYRTSSGAQAQTVRGTTDGSKLFVSGNDHLVTNELKAAAMYNGSWAADPRATGANAVLFDNSIAATSKTSMPATSGVAAIIWDLGETKALTFTGADVLIQQDSFGLRNIGSLRLEGSNDRSSWTPLTTSFSRDLGWQRSDSLNSTTAYRYVRLFNEYQIALMELRVFGTVGAPLPPDTKAPDVTAALDGDNVTVTAADDRGLAAVSATILDSTGQTMVAELGSLNPNGETSAEHTWALPTDLAPATYTIKGTATDAAGNVGSTSTAYVALPKDAASAVPAKAVLSHDNGWDTGLQDGNYNVKMNLWWGENGSLFRLYENGTPVAAVPLTYDGLKAQSAAVPITGKPNGTYVYTGELVNSKGITATTSATVKVTDANPGTPVLSHNNWDGDGTFSVTANMWSGTNATRYTFFENETPIASGPLEAHTPQSQKAIAQISGKATGTSTYRVEFANDQGTTSSLPLTVTVKSQ